MNANAERWIGGCRRELLDRTLIWNQPHLRRILRQYQTHHNQHRPHRSLHAAAPLKPLPEPVDLEQYRVRRQTRIGALINEYHLVVWRGRGYRHPQVLSVLLLGPSSTYGRSRGDTHHHPDETGQRNRGRMRSLRRRQGSSGPESPGHPDVQRTCLLEEGY
jgi:Integrase core domain